MKALYFDGSEVQLKEVPIPVPKEHEVLLKVHLAGICNTDLEVMRGYKDFKGILGHEFVGQVVEDMRGDLLGKRVVGRIWVVCHQCPYCRSRAYSHCANRLTMGIHGLNGSFSQYLCLPRENLYEIPDSLTDEEAVLLEPFAAGVRIGEQLNAPGAEVLVLGDGKLGLLSAMALWAMGYRVKLVGKHENKMKILQPLSIPTYYYGEYDEPKELVVDCTGSPRGPEQALSLTKPLGTVLLKTTTAEQIPMDLNRLVVDEITLLGSRCGPFPKAIELMAHHDLPLASLIEAVFPLEEGLKALAYAGEKGRMKVLLQIE